MKINFIEISKAARQRQREDNISNKELSISLVRIKCSFVMDPFIYKIQMFLSRQIY